MADILSVYLLLKLMRDLYFVFASYLQANGRNILYNFQLTIYNYLDYLDSILVYTTSFLYNSTFALVCRPGVVSGMKFTFT